MSGMHVNIWILKQLPMVPLSACSQELPWLGSSVQQFVEPRALELTYTAYDLADFAAATGYTGTPFKWSLERRYFLRCELDAVFFHLYGIDRDDVDYIMETFPIVRRTDEAAHGEYRTKRVILEIYDRMLQAIESGHPYKTILDPPPADSRCSDVTSTSETTEGIA
jgi:hypothetical protein